MRCSWNHSTHSTQQSEASHYMSKFARYEKCPQQSVLVSLVNHGDSGDTQHQRHPLSTLTGWPCMTSVGPVRL